MKSSWILPCLVLAGVSLVTEDAHAFEFGTPASAHPFRSPQNFELEIRFSPYHPAVDKEPGLHGTPFKDRFGDGARLYFGLEFDWQLLRIPYVGTIGPGLGVGRVTMSRTAVTKENPPQPSGDEYSLDIYPMYLAAVLRGDVLWRDAGIPIVPYAKLGLGYGPWVASNSLGTSSFNGSRGKGGSFGTQVALGAAFALDALDLGASRNMDNSTGINNTYFYAEYYWLTLDGLGQSNALYVGTNTYAMGLAFEF
jgi:hypothetical protein